MFSVLIDLQTNVGVKYLTNWVTVRGGGGCELRLCHQLGSSECICCHQLGVIWVQITSSAGVIWVQLLSSAGGHLSADYVISWGSSECRLRHQPGSSECSCCHHLYPSAIVCRNAGYFQSPEWLGVKIFIHHHRQIRIKPKVDNIRQRNK